MSDWRAAFFTLHQDLPREGPGDRATLDWALDLAGVKKDARILDAGCGPGADVSGLLDHAPQGQVTAIDLQDGFVAAVRAKFDDDPRVVAQVGDMTEPGGQYDLIWCSSAIYAVGVTEGLRAWRDALAPGGKVAFSEAVWLTESPDEEPAAFWNAEYPTMTGVDGVADKIAAAGYRLLGQRQLPDAAWEAYYTPLETRANALRAGAGDAMVQVLDEADAEIGLWRRYRDQFGYAAFVVAPA